MKALKCDRCHKYYDDESTQTIYIREKGHETMDLCDDCYAFLVTWLNEFKPAPTPVDPDPTDPTTDPDTPGDTTDPDTPTDPTTDPEGGDGNG